MKSASIPEQIFAERTYDAAYIKSVITELWDTVAEDNASLDDWSAECVSECWLDLQGKGVFYLHPANSTTLILHAHVLKPFRFQSVEIGYAVWSWVLSECPQKYQKFNCTIPVLYPNVKKYALTMGMVEEGVNRQSYCKNGQIVDQWMLGITRKEIEEFMHV